MTISKYEYGLKKIEQNKKLQARHIEMNVRAKVLDLALSAAKQNVGKVPGRFRRQELLYGTGCLFQRRSFDC